VCSGQTSLVGTSSLLTAYHRKFLPIGAMHQTLVDTDNLLGLVTTSSSAIAEGPRDALSQLQSCQLLHNCMKRSHLTRRIALSCGIKISPVGSLD